MNVKRRWDENDQKNMERIKSDVWEISRSKETFSAADIPAELKKDICYYFGCEAKLIKKLGITNYKKRFCKKGLYADDHDLSAGIDLTETLMQTNPEFFMKNGEIKIDSKCWDCALAVTVPGRQCAWFKRKVIPKGTEYYTANSNRTNGTHPPTYTVINCRHFLPDGALDAENKKYRAHNKATEENYDELRQAVLRRMVEDYIALYELNMPAHSAKLAELEDEILTMASKEFLEKVKYKIKKEREKNEQS